MSRPFDNNFSLLFTPMGTLEPMKLLQMDGRVYTFCTSADGEKMFLSIRKRPGEVYHGFMFDVRNTQLTPYESLNKIGDCVWVGDDLVVARSANGARDVLYVNTRDDTEQLLESGSGNTYLTASRDGRVVAWRYDGEREYSPYMKIWLRDKDEIVDASSLGTVGDISLSKDGSRLAYIEIRRRSIKVLDVEKILRRIQ